MRVALVAISFLLAIPAQGKDLGLRSDGGPWRFYPAKDADASLPRVLLIGDSIMNGYRGAVSSHLEGNLTDRHGDQNGHEP